MKAVIITGHPGWKDGLNPQTQAIWESYLKEMPQITSYALYNVYGHSPAELESYIGDADYLVGWFIGPETVNEAFFERHPNLKYISTLSMGYGGFDRELVKKRGVTITNTLYGANTIAQYTFALLLDICHDIKTNSDYIKNTDWASSGTGRADMFVTPQYELYEKTLGIIGIGNVGLWVAKMAAAFGMKVIGSSRTRKTGPGYELIEQVSQDELLARSDVISLNCSLNASTRGIINKESISKMKDGVILLNSSRGDLIVEKDLAEALNSGKVAAAGLDATDFDRLHAHTPLMDCPNTRITGHIAWYPMEARLRDVRIAAQNLKNYLEGHPTSVVS